MCAVYNGVSGRFQTQSEADIPRIGCGERVAVRSAHGFKRECPTRPIARVSSSITAAAPTALQEHQACRMPNARIERSGFASNRLVT